MLGLALVLGLPGLADAGEVRAVKVDGGVSTTRAEIDLAGAGEYKTLTLAGPDRVVVDLPASSAARGLQLPAGAGIVKGVRTGQPVAGTLRIVFDLAGPSGAPTPRVETLPGGSKLVLEWQAGSAMAATAAPTPTPVAYDRAAANKASPVPMTAAQATAALTAAAARQASAAPAVTPAAQVAMTIPGASTSARSPADILNGRAPTTTVVGSQSPVPEASPGFMVATDVPSPAPDAAPTPAAPAPAAATPAFEPPPMRMGAGMRPLVIAIDAGHGGQDPGAIGPGGTHEKNVVLAIARELARRIDATPGMKAYMVRDGDYFLPLPQRAQKARAARADMFVSIHADAAENRNARGSSVYVLSLKGASSQRARWLANKENASDLIGGVRLHQADNTLSSVLLDLAQSGHMKASEDAANHVLSGLKRVGNNHKPHIERANFAVLRTSDMPSMLVETAFISNQEEEQRLLDPAYQRKVAAAVLDGVQTYFTQQPPPGTLFAARAQAEVAASSGASGSAGSP